MQNLSVVLQNEIVKLRPLQLSDFDALWPIAQEQGMWTYGLKDLTEPTALKQYIESAIQKREAGLCAVWVIIDASTDTVVGCTRLAEISWNDERGQIGWTWISKAFQGKGLNKAMKFEILKYGFETLKLNRIELKADARNIQSRKAILKIGAKEEGTLRQHMKIHNGYIRDTVFYSILKTEWPKLKQEIFNS